MGITYLMGGNPLDVLSLVNQSETQMGSTGSASAGKFQQEMERDRETVDFLSVVLAETEDTWAKLLPGYRAPKLVLFSGSTPSACGLGSAAMGPFYCPGDNKLYLDLTFLGELKRLGGEGDFAVAYVVAHEVAHHVQNIQGRLTEARDMQRRVNKIQANAIQVQTELQADCYAGLWAHHAGRDRNILEPGDLEEALQAAAAVGDDRLVKGIRPESFTHGSAKQRSAAFLAGFKGGSLDSCSIN